VRRGGRKKVDKNKKSPRIFKKKKKRKKKKERKNEKIQKGGGEGEKKRKNQRGKDKGVKHAQSFARKGMWTVEKDYRVRGTRGGGEKCLQGGKKRKKHLQKKKKKVSLLLGKLSRGERWSRGGGVL